MSTEINNTDNGLNALLAKAETMTVEEKVRLMKALGFPVSSNGVARIPRVGEETISYKDNGKEKLVRLYISDKGGVHFQGMPGTSAKWGITLYASTISFIIENQDKIIEFMDANSSKLSVKEKAN
jgi:hypothetical protein